MVNKIFSWVGGGLLTGLLALGSHGGAATPSGSAAWQAAQDRLDCARARLDDAWDRLELRASALAERAAALADRAAAASERLFQDPAPVTADQDREQEGSVSVTIQGPSWLGIRMQEVTPENVKELKLTAERGVLVTRVVKDSPAEKAGLKVNDVITEFDGQRVEGVMALERMVHEVPSGRSVSITVWRDGSAQTLRAELSAGRGFTREGGNRMFMMGPGEGEFHVEVPPIPEMPEMPPIPPIPAIQIGPFGTFRAFGAPMLGIDAEDLSGQLGNYFGAPDGEGILVREVMPGTPAEKAGLKAGDVILRVDGNRVRNADELRSALREKAAKASGEADTEKAAPVVTADLTVLRAGKQTVVRVELQPPVRRLHSVHRLAV
jgi:serine protease Do